MPVRSWRCSAVFKMLTTACLANIRKSVRILKSHPRAEGSGSEMENLANVSEPQVSDLE